MIPGIIGKKLGMTQIYTEEGKSIPVTVIEAGPCQIQQLKSVEKDGYSAVKLGFEVTKEKRIKKPQRVYAKNNGLEPMKFSREIRCESEAELKVGEMVMASDFQAGDFMDISGISKGKGFQGGMKRFGWSGGEATHGSRTHRVPGSIGASATPAKVFKGHSMPGQMGNVKITVQNVEVVDVDSADNTITVKGSVPGANGSYLLLRLAKKKPVKPRPERPQQNTEETSSVEEDSLEEKKPKKEENDVEKKSGLDSTNREAAEKDVLQEEKK